MMERWHKVRNFLNNGRNQTTGEVVYGRYLQDLPSRKIAEIEKSAQSAFCAPHKCLEEVHSSVKKRLNKNTEEPQEPIFENVFDWSQGKEYADGLVTSLYERSTKDGQKKYMGDPIADSLAVVTRRNSAILALADGVSWGPKSRLAATCGIYGSVKYLNDNLANCKTTKDVFNQILKGFEQAQNCIVSEQGTMTTLCVAVVVPMPEKERYGLCVVNVGDSYAYVFNKHYGVKEVTEGSHPINEVRDMRNSGGALGPADGYNPDLSNLTCSFIIIEKGDLVFLCSDGISDNFDPVIAKHSPPRMEVKSLPSSFEASTELSKKEFRKQKTESFEELDNAPDIHVESVREEPICASCLKKSAETPVETNEKQNSLDFLPKVNVDELIAMKNKRNSPEHFQDVMNTDDNARRKSPEIFTDPLRKTSPAISDLFPAYDKTKVNKPNLQKTDSVKIPVCQKCGKALRRITEWCLPYLGDRRSSVLDCLPKLSESTSMDRISEEKKTSAEETRGKSHSFTNSNDAPSPTVELDKEAKIAKLHNASSMGRLTSQSSLDEITGQKTKETPANELTPAERRDGALQHMTQIISKKLEMDEGTSQNIIVGEVCAQVINYVIGNTNEKRTILERVPQSELNQMSSQDRRLHREKIKKELEGVPGKLDHASIVCYEVGYHDDSKEIISLDPTKSTVAEPKELKNVKKSFFRSFSSGASLPAPKTDSSVDVSSQSVHGYEERICDEISCL